jgi:predicted DNA-binding transcriptional regulator AlpA
MNRPTRPEQISSAVPQKPDSSALASSGEVRRALAVAANLPTAPCEAVPSSLCLLIRGSSPPCAARSSNKSAVSFATRKIFGVPHTPGKNMGSAPSLPLSRWTSLAFDQISEATRLFVSVWTVIHTHKAWLPPQNSCCLITFRACSYLSPFLPNKKWRIAPDAAKGEPMPDFPTDRLISERATAEILNFSADTLRRLGRRGEGPTRRKISPRRVGYRLSEVEAYRDGRPLQTATDRAVPRRQKSSHRSRS